MNRYTLVILSVLGGILTGMAWTTWGSGLVLLISLVPFFLIEDYLFNHPKRFSANSFFIYILPGFVIFSIMGMGWMRVASMTGAICVIMGLSFIMAFVTWLAHIVRVRTNIYIGMFSMITFWLTYEYASLNINIVSPWINLGNGLSKDIKFIQWYDITGTGGGSLWILISNLLLSAFIVRALNKKKTVFLTLILWLLTIVVPSAYSVYRYNEMNIHPVTEGSSVVIVQPNIDPYTEKFTVPFEKQLKNVIDLAKPEITKDTKWIITPETTIDDPANLDSLQNDKYIKGFKGLTAYDRDLNIVAGLVTYRIYPGSSFPPTISARKIDKSGEYFDHFNSAVRIDSSSSNEVYHKSKLVPGIEMQFSTGPGRFISKILPDLGGTRWGYGMQEERSVFTHSSTGMKVATVICYESVFGQFVTGFIKKGAQVIFIITNDGWWKGTNGYAQHLSFASLRAIETRREIARAGNTGISCLINKRGERISETQWWTRTVLKGIIYPESSITFYVKYGDYILLASTIISVIIFLVIFVAIPVRKKF
jgi:apolipoprotein N-acyltransferase